MIIYATNAFNWLKPKTVIKNCVCVCVCMCMYEITKETWEKCGIKTFIYHNEEEKMNKLWHKMSDIEAQLRH